MQIKLVTTPAEKIWGKNALLSFQNNTTSIHITSSIDSLSIQKAARKLRNQNISSVKLIGEYWNLENCWAFYQGFYTAKQNYNIDFPELTDKENKLLSARIDCGNFVREIINLPSSTVTPLELVERASDFITDIASHYNEENTVKINIISGEKLKLAGLNGIWNVGKGSIQSPALLELDFNPTYNDNEPVMACLVGKGITFDSGGYSIKPSDNMSTMRTDMGGAALLTGALGMAIASGLNKRVKLFLCCAENMISDRAMKLGDIIHYSNNISVEVLNTDAEGRLVLADGLICAEKQHPEFIIDCATLTGAAKVAVGNDYHSILSQDDNFVAELFQAAKQNNEPFWRLPFEDFHRKQICSTFGDIANISTVPVAAGASTATAFLSYFLNNYKTNWLHIDCSATYRKSASDLWATGATGIGVQTLATLLLNKAKDEGVLGYE